MGQEFIKETFKMKVDKQAKKKAAKGIQSTQVNSGKKFGLLALLLGCTAVGIISVMNIGKKAEETVDVCMISADGAYKNQMITADMVKSYPMLKAEYEKYSITDSNGKKERRLILYEDVNDITGYYAAYPLLGETLLEKKFLVSSKVDNSDTVLFSFPGKDIVQLNIGSSDLNAFKTFLQPGDKLNIEAIYSEQMAVDSGNGYGGSSQDKVDVFRTETVFGNIMIADLINSSGDSILDIYSDYNSKNTWQQSQLDNSEEFQRSTTPASLLVALTPAEKETYYKYLAKDNIEFRVSLPQRTQ